MTFSLLRNSRRSLAFVLLTSCVAIAACSGKTDDSNPPGDGDGDGDGDSSGGTSGDGDGDSSGGTSGDGDGDSSGGTSPGGMSGDGDASSGGEDGSGGDGSGGDGSGGAPACTDDAGCEVADEPFCYENSSVECSNTDEDVCLEMVTVTSCEADTFCSEGGSSPTCESGDACDGAIVVPAGGMLFSGASFSADFADDYTLTGTDCPSFPAGTSDAVFRIDMKAGEVLNVYETAENEMDLYAVLTKSCAAAATCELTNDDPDGIGPYVAEVDETVFLFLSSYSSSAGNQDNPYSIAFKRQMLTSIGTFDAGDPIPSVSHDAEVPVGGSAMYAITFTEPVWLSGTLTRKTIGDADLVVLDSTYDEAFYSAGDGDEEWTDRLLAPGTYYFIVSPFAQSEIPIAPGFDLTLVTQPYNDLGVLAHGGTLMFDGALPEDDAFDIFTFELTALTAVSGSITGTSGDPDYSIVDETGDSVVSGSASGMVQPIDEITLPAGTYYLRLRGYTPVASYSLVLNGAAP